LGPKEDNGSLLADWSDTADAPLPRRRLTGRT
jgi:hypothetical protein